MILAQRVRGSEIHSCATLQMPRLQRAFVQDTNAHRHPWSELVFEAYVNNRSDVIFLAGLPDVAESRPHSRINNQ